MSARRPTVGCIPCFPKSRSGKELAILRSNRVKEIANELILHLEGHFLGKPHGRNSNEGTIGDDSAQSILQPDDLAINDAGRDIIANSHPITDRLEPRLTFCNYTSKFHRKLGIR